MRKFRVTYSLDGETIHVWELEVEKQDMAAAFDASLTYIEEEHNLSFADEEVKAISILFLDAVKKGHA